MKKEEKHKILKLETKKRLFKSKSIDEIYNTLSDDLKCRSRSRKPLLVNFFNSINTISIHKNLKKIFSQGMDVN